MSYPFIYLNHGPLDPESFGKVDAVWLAFRRPVLERERREIMASCPAAVAGFFRWGETLFYSESASDDYAFLVEQEHGDSGDGTFEVSAQAAVAFAEEIERWVQGIHARTPLVFFVGPGRPMGDDAWGQWSRAHVGTVVIPWLERYLDEHPDLPEIVEDEWADLDDESDAALGAAPLDRYFLSSIVPALESAEMPGDLAERLSALRRRIQPG